MKKNIKTLAALLIASATFAACSSENDKVNDNQQPTELTTPKTCTLTVNATKGNDATTRALTLDETSTKNVLNATWTEGDEVTVYYMHEQDMGGGHIMSIPTEIGTLTAESTGALTTLTGEITTKGIIIRSMFGSSSETTHDLTAGDKLYLSYGGTLSDGSNYYNEVNNIKQDGSLQTLANYFDKAGAYVTVGSFSSSMVTISEEAAVFENNSFIIRFKLQDKAGNAISPSKLTLECTTTWEYPLVGTDEINIPASTYETNTAGVVFVQLQQTNQTTGFSGDITLTATVGDDTYAYTKTGVNFINGKYYEITVKMTRQPRTYDLSQVTNNIILRDGDILTGTLGENHKISIADGATVTLDNASINADGTWTTGYYAGITCLGDAIIILKDGTTNTVKGFYNTFPGIQPAVGKTLTITGETEGTGSLDASSNGNGAGIGSGYNLSCGNIIISGGIIIATGGFHAAGIGSAAYNASCGDITIESTVTRVKAVKGRGIGFKEGEPDPNNHNSIGAGQDSSCGTVTIGGVVTGFISQSPYNYLTTHITVVDLDLIGTEGMSWEEIVIINGDKLYIDSESNQVFRSSDNYVLKQDGSAVSRWGTYSSANSYTFADPWDLDDWDD